MMVVGDGDKESEWNCVIENTGMLDFVELNE